jgi:hypothetical protein
MPELSNQVCRNNLIGQRKPIRRDGRSIAGGAEMEQVTRQGEVSHRNNLPFVFVECCCSFFLFIAQNLGILSLNCHTEHA